MTAERPRRRAQEGGVRKKTRAESSRREGEEDGEKIADARERERERESSLVKEHTTWRSAEIVRGGFDAIRGRFDEEAVVRG